MGDNEDKLSTFKIKSMNKQEIQNNIVDAVLDTEIYDQVIVANITFNQFADEPTTVQVEINISDIEEWIEQSGLLIQDQDIYNSDYGHTTIETIVDIEDFDIDNDVIREFIRTNDKFSIL